MKITTVTFILIFTLLSQPKSWAFDQMILRGKVLSLNGDEITVEISAPFCKGDHTYKMLRKNDLQEITEGQVITFVLHGPCDDEDTRLRLIMPVKGR